MHTGRSCHASRGQGSQGLGRSRQPVAGCRVGCSLGQGAHPGHVWGHWEPQPQIFPAAPMEGAGRAPSRSARKRPRERGAKEVTDSCLTGSGEVLTGRVRDTRGERTENSVTSWH